MLKVRNSNLFSLLIRLSAIEWGGRDFKYYIKDYGKNYIKDLDGSDMMQLKDECETILKTIIEVMDELLTEEVTHDEINES